MSQTIIKKEIVASESKNTEAYFENRHRNIQAFSAML